MWSCKQLDDVWGANNLWSFQNQQCFASFSELLDWVCDHQRNPTLFAFNIWSIWHQRNQVRTQQPHRPLNLLSQWAYDRYMEFKALKAAPTSSRPKSRIQWRPPIQGTLKINFDGAIFTEEKCSGLGAIIRDSEGLVIASLVTQVPQQL